MAATGLVATAQLRLGPPLEAAAYAELRRRAIFECDKWDPQVGDRSTLAPAPLVLSADAWTQLARTAEALAAETLAAEAELVHRPDLHKRLALPRAITRLFARHATPAAGIARIMRFDFHPTPDGWRLSEANTDVPGGSNEASGWTALVAAHCPGLVPAGDVAQACVDALLAHARPGACVALVHATSFADDRQVMTYLARRLRAAGARTVLASPAHLVWRDGHARLAGPFINEPVDRIVRFFPAEWLPDLPRRSGWPHLFVGGRTPASNPGQAVLTQTKRFPLVWDALTTPLDAWREALPETRDPRDAPRADGAWVYKPALGRVGEDVCVRGVTEAAAWTRAMKDVARHPRHWIAQRRFEVIGLPAGDTHVYPCLGVYTVDGRAAGIYGRIADNPVIDAHARDVAVLVEAAESWTRSRIP